MPRRHDRLQEPERQLQSIQEEMNSYNVAEDADSRIWSQIWWVAEASKTNNTIPAYLGRVKSAAWFRAAESLRKELIHATPEV